MAFTLKRASIGARKYILSNRDVVELTSEGSRTIEPGETETYSADTCGGAGVRVLEVSMKAFTYYMDGYAGEMKFNLNKVHAISSPEPAKSTASLINDSEGLINEKNELSEQDEVLQSKEADPVAIVNESPEGVWIVDIGGYRTKLTLLSNGRGEYLSSASANGESYPSRWHNNGNQVRMKVYGTMTHVNSDDPAFILELTINGSEIEGIQRELTAGRKDFKVKGQKQ